MTTTSDTSDPSQVAYWDIRWKDGRTAFHEGRANAFLAKHAARLEGRGRVLVPLCGKAEDMVYLASQGHEVLGIEGVEAPVKAFFAEHDLTPEIRDVNEHVRSYTAKGITILVGDVFACTKSEVGDVSALYDRAALVALPADVRPRYVAHLRSLLTPGAHGLVVTFDYPQHQMPGPPFSVGEDEVRKLYSGAKVEQIDHAAVGSEGRFREAGVQAIERCFFVSL